MRVIICEEQKQIVVIDKITNLSIMDRNSCGEYLKKPVVCAYTSGEGVTLLEALDSSKQAFQFMKWVANYMVTNDEKSVYCREFYESAYNNA